MSPKVPLLCHFALRCVGPACERERRRPYVCPILSGGRREGGTKSASLPFPIFPLPRWRMRRTRGRGRALPRIASSAIYQSTYDVGAPLNAAVVARLATALTTEASASLALLLALSMRAHTLARASALRKTAKIKWSVRSFARSLSLRKDGGQFGSTLPAHITHALKSLRKR